MKLANRAYVIALLMLMLVFAVPAQMKSEKDDRNTAPTVGTGGPVGGPTGLFTVYDASTLRKGEYTLSAALSNYDRDPGNVDISTVPLSFQIGVTNKLELFFNTEAWRGIKVNSPRNLSSFYLPNSQLNIGGFLGSPAAMVLAPRGPGANAFVNSAIFRPAGAPFVAGTNLFTGGTLGRMGFVPFSGPAFGFAAGTNASIGAPVKGGASDLFPGVGSVYGSILPGVVLSTQTFFLPGSTTVSTGTGPLSFSTVPTYLPDAPFVNRTYGTSAFNSMDVGFKWRFNSPSAAWGHGVSAFYRWYPDNAGTASGFNQMQRGAGPGSNNGDIGLTYFADARVTKWANVSGNVGYVYTSKIKGTSAGTQYTILDPADELQLSVGVDFPVNRFFQPIMEFRSLRYIGGHTPNALENNPYDGLAGFRVYPRRWFGFGLAYRYNFNQQDVANFKNDTTSNTLTQLCGNVGGACSNTSTVTTVSGIPGGLNTSSDANGYIAQFWVGRRDKRQGEVLNKPANVDSVDLSMTVITLPCRPGFKSKSGACSDTGKMISVATKASDPENDVLTYNYTVSGGRVVGTGANVQWDLTSAQVGTYTITTGVDDGCGVCGKTDTKTIKVQECPDCVAPEVPVAPCPTVSVSGPSGITAPGGSMTFTATANGDVTYNWSVSAGTISSGQGTPSITVSVPGDMGNGNITATVDTSGPRAACKASASDTAGVASVKPTSSQVDEFGPQKDDEIKARVDNFYIQLNNNPSAKGFVIIYGNAAQIKKVKAQLDKAITFRKYDKSRLTFVDGPDNGTQNTKFYLVPAGADNPMP